MTDLVEFLRARLDQDERTARQALTDPDNDRGQGVRVMDGELAIMPSAMSNGLTLHFVRHDPARVLLDLESKRQIIDTVMAWRHHVSEDCWYTCGAATEERDGGECCNEDDLGKCTCGLEIRQRSILAPLATPDAGHPDYRQEWKP